MDSVESNALRLLSLIVKAAQLDAHQHAERHDLLRQASALLWWLEPGSPPRMIANLLSCLSLPLEQWLDSRFRQVLKTFDETIQSNVSLQRLDRRVACHRTGLEFKNRLQRFEPPD